MADEAMEKLSLGWYQFNKSQNNAESAQFI